MFQVGDFITIDEPRIDMRMGTPYKINEVKQGDVGPEYRVIDDVDDPQWINATEAIGVIIVSIPATPPGDLNPTEAFVAGYTLGVNEGARVASESLDRVKARSEEAFGILNDIQRLIDGGRRR